MTRTMRTWCIVNIFLNSENLKIKIETYHIYLHSNKIIENKKERHIGIEPMTHNLEGYCSTTELMAILQNDIIDPTGIEPV